MTTTRRRAARTRLAGIGAALALMVLAVACGGDAADDSTVTPPSEEASEGESEEASEGESEEASEGESEEASEGESEEESEEPSEESS